MVIVANLTVCKPASAYTGCKELRNFLSVIGGHLKKVRLPLLQGKHLAFFARILHFIRLLTNSLHTLRPSDGGITSIQNLPLAPPQADSSF
jgi:hypothetical protein